MRVQSRLNKNLLFHSIFGSDLLLQVLDPVVSLVQLGLYVLHDLQLVCEAGELVPEVPHFPRPHVHHQLEAVHLDVAGLDLWERTWSMVIFISALLGQNVLL